MVAKERKVQVLLIVGVRFHAHKVGYRLPLYGGGTHKVKGLVDGALISQGEVQVVGVEDDGFRLLVQFRRGEGAVGVGGAKEQDIHGVFLLPIEAPIGCHGAVILTLLSLEIEDQGETGEQERREEDKDKIPEEELCLFSCRKKEKRRIFRGTGVLFSDAAVLRILHR